MLESMVALSNYSYTYAAWPPVIVGACMAVLALAVLIRGKVSQVSVAFSGLILCAAVWLFSFGGIYCAQNSSVAFFWARVEQTGVAFIPSCLFYFSLIIVKRLRQYRLAAWGCLWVSCIFALVMWGTHLFIQGLVNYPWGFYPHYGPAGTLFLIFSFSVAITSVALLYQKAYHQVSLDPQHDRFKSFLLAYSIGFLAAIDFLACYHIAVYPVGFLPAYTSVLILAQTIWRYQFKDLTAGFAAPQILATMPGALFVLDPDGIICIANERASDYFEKSIDELQGSPIQNLLRNFFTSEHLNTLQDEGTFHDERFTVKRVGASPRQLTISMSAIGEAGGEAMGYVCVALDVTRQQHTVEALRMSEARFQKLIDSNIIGFMMVDSEGRVIEANSAFLKLLGYNREDLVSGLVGGEVMTPSEYHHVDQWMQEKLKINGLCPPVEKEFVRKDGSRVPVLVGVVMLDSSTKNCLCFVIDASERRAAQDALVKAYDELELRVEDRTQELQQEIEKREKAEEALRNQTVTDALTGLLNRRGFIDRAEQHLLLAQRQNRGLMLFMADLDDLKPINDTYGHPEGDRALTEIGRILQHTFRASDVVARIGGDEFAIVAFEEHETDSEHILRRLRGQILARNEQPARLYPLGLSMGMARMSPKDPLTLERLMLLADAALYEKKKNKNVSQDLPRVIEKKVV